MGLFGSKKEGGLMDVIRCDEKEYLIWKWSPTGEKSRRENAIRYGSSLRVKDGEVAVFVYKQQNGAMQDFIEGPFDQTIKTANFPVLTSIVGSAFGGASPFQAEIYFINLAGIVQIPFFVDEFGLRDPRFMNHLVPAKAKGKITFNITDYRSFIKLHRMIDFTLDDLERQVRSAMDTLAKDTIMKAPRTLNVPLVGIQEEMKTIAKILTEDVKQEFADDFGINVKRVDISAITFDTESEVYKKVYEMSAQAQEIMIESQTFAGAKNIVDQQAIYAANLEDSLSKQREETQRAQRLQTEGANLTAHQIDVQGDVAKTAAASLGQLGGSGGASFGDGGGGGGMNPAAMMTGMMMGGAVGGSMSNMIGNMTNNMNQPQPPAPPTGAVAEYHISVNGQQAGPYNMAQLQQMVAAGQMDKATYIWKTGMAGWEPAGNVGDVAQLFAAVPPPPPPAAPVPPPPPAPAPPAAPQGNTDEV